MIVIDKLSKNDSSNGMGVIKRLWGENHILARNKQLYEWSYYNEYDETSGLYIIKDNDHVFGCIGKMPILGHIYGKNVETSVISLYVVDKNYRSSAYGVKLLDHVIKDKKIVVINGINNRVARLYKFKGFDIKKLNRFVVILNDNDFLAYYKYYFNNEIDFDIISYNASTFDSAFALETFTENYVDKWDFFWKKFSLSHIGTIKDFSFIKWRYIDHPVFYYYVKLFVNLNKEILGLVVYRIINLPNNLKLLRITELLTLDDSYKKYILSHLAIQYKNEIFAIEFINTGNNRWCSYKGIYNADGLLSTYFSPPRAEHCSILSAFKGVDIELDDCYCSIGDGDQDRPN